MNIETMAQKAKEASIQLLSADTDIKNAALLSIGEALLTSKDAIIAANQADLARSEQEGLASPLLKRLKFDEKKLNDTVEGIRSLSGLEDPVGKTLLATQLDKGLDLYRVSCPIGVLGIIFESRPDALVQISTLCLKSGNSVLLKGGSEARETNEILARIISEASVAAGMPENWIQLIHTREDVNEMLKMDKYINLLIPRGSNEFVRYIMDHSAIPVMGHADGICHVYIDEAADIDMAVKIAVDSKTQYVAVCNATETLLVHKDIAQSYLPAAAEALQQKNVELVGCERTAKIIDVPVATEEDWATEYLDYKLSIRVVDSLEDAVEHINSYGSGHTDTIVTGDEAAAGRFMTSVDSGNVMWNCSTRFSDGFKYGFGAEVGISTSKLHARGPVGLEGLVTYKYKVIGRGQVVADYAEGRSSFTHKKLDNDCPV